LERENEVPILSHFRFEFIPSMSFLFSATKSILAAWHHPLLQRIIFKGANNIVNISSDPGDYPNSHCANSVVHAAVDRFTNENGDMVAVKQLH
jgi:hypothetical protein